jgi:hypothetical protein
MSNTPRKQKTKFYIELGKEKTNQVQGVRASRRAGGPEAKGKIRPGIKKEIKIAPNALGSSCALSSILPRT